MPRGCREEASGRKRPDAVRSASSSERDGSYDGIGVAAGQNVLALRNTSIDACAYGAAGSRHAYAGGSVKHRRIARVRIQLIRKIVAAGSHPAYRGGSRRARTRVGALPKRNGGARTI